MKGFKGEEMRVESMCGESLLLKADLPTPPSSLLPPFFSEQQQMYKMHQPKSMLYSMMRLK